MRHLKSYIPEESLSGVTTVVTDNSKKGLPGNSDREKETNLPPGAATPKTVKPEDSAGGNDRHLKQPAFNGPGTGENGPAENPRSLPTPGEEAGSPTKFDYGMPTRRSMEGSDKEAYKARLPWRRQKSQRTWKKLKDRQYYRQNKSQIKQRLKVWYRQVRKNQNFQSQKKRRRENADKFKRRKVAMSNLFAELSVQVAARWLKQTGELGLIERVSPDEWEKPVYNNRPERPVGPGQWTKTDPAPTHDPTPSDFVPPNDADFPASSGKVIPEYMKYASTTPDQLFKGLRTPESDFDLGLWEEDAGHTTIWFLGWWDYDWDTMGGILGERGIQDPEAILAEQVALANGAERVDERFVWENKTRAVKAARQIVREIQAYRRNHKTAATMDDLTNRTSGDITKRSKGVQIRLSRADPSRGVWTFKASGSSGGSYTIRLKAEAKGGLKEIKKAQVRVSCDCDFFRWQGPEHWAHANNFLYGKPRGAATNPTEKDPKGVHWICKHVAAALQLAQKYRLAGEGPLFPFGAEIVPDGYGEWSGG